MPTPSLLSHVADVLQPIVAAVFRQTEANVSGLLPAAADLSELTGQAGQQKDQAAQQDDEGEDQDQSKGRGQVKVVLGRVKGTVPSKYQCVDSGRGQGAVTQRGLQGEKERKMSEVEPETTAATVGLSSNHLTHIVFPLNSQQYSAQPQVSRWPSTADWTLPPCICICPQGSLVKWNIPRLPAIKSSLISQA